MAKTQSNARTVTFTKEKDTKNTVKFMEDAVAGQPPVIGQLYVQKWVVGEATKVTLTIEVGE